MRADNVEGGARQPVVQELDVASAVSSTQRCNSGNMATAIMAALVAALAARVAALVAALAAWVAWAACVAA